MGDTLVLQKNQIRRRIREQLRSLTNDDLATGSRLVCEFLLNLPVWQQATSVCLYHPIGLEPDVRALLPAALNAGKKLFLPRFNTSTQGYEVGPVRDLARELQPGRFRIPEPATAAQPIEPIDVVLVPGLAFSRNGGRLGRGAGYYDKMLAFWQTVKCGVAFDCQVVEELPVESHDVRMDYLVSPAGVWRCSG